MSDSTDAIIRELEQLDRAAQMPVHPGWTWAIPEALGDEDGENYFWPGHIDPALAVLSVVVSEMLNCDGDRAAKTLVGDRRWDEQSLRFVSMTWQDHLTRASGLLAAVEHYYAREHPDDEERQLVVSADDPHGEPWTRLYVGP